MNGKLLYVGIVACAVMLLPSCVLAFTTPELEEAGVSFIGYAEFLLQYKQDAPTDSTDLSVESLKLGVDYRPIDWVFAYAVFDFGNGLGEAKVNEGYLEFGGTDALPPTIRIGRFYLPMGGYSSVFCQDPLCTAPLTKVLTETQDEAIQIGYTTGPVQLKAGIANGTSDKTDGSDDLDLYYANVEVVPMEGVTIGLTYTSDLADSIELAKVMPEDGIVDEVPGYSAYVIYEAGPVYARVGYAAALENFAAADLDGNADGVGDEPSAYELVVAYDVTPTVRLGAMYSASDDFDTFVDDEYGFVVAYTVYEGVTLLFEYINGVPCCSPEGEVYQARLKMSF